MTSLPSTIMTLNRQIGDLTNQLEPVTNEQVMKGVKSLLTAGLSLPSAMFAAGEDGKEDEVRMKAPEIYAFALAGIPRVGFHRAIQKIIRGEYEISKAFVPTAPELAAISRLEAKPLREDLTRLKERMAALEPPKHQPISKEGRAKVRALLKDFRQKNAERRAREAVPEMPFNGGQKEYYAKILAMKDAPSVTEEQAEFRSKIASKLEG